MRIFGFDIVRCSNKDREELETYKLVTKELFNRLVEALDFIGDLIHKDDEEMDDEAVIQLLFERVETICKLILLYDQNKFSTPITAVSMLQRMNVFRENASHIQTLLLQHAMTKDQLVNVGEMYEDDEFSNLEEEFDRVEQHYLKSRKHLLKILFSDINKMISVIQYDLFCIIFGVDIIRLYRSRQRKITKKKPDYEVKIFNHFESHKSNGGN